MICGEEHLSSTWDKPRGRESTVHVLPSADDVVMYRSCPDNRFWLKTIRLEQCDRSDLASLLAFISNIQKISPFRAFACGSNEPPTHNVHYGLFLPKLISLHGTELTLSYPLCKSSAVHELLKPYYVDGGLPESLVVAIFSRAVRSLSKLHDLGWIHRAICARHLLFHSSSENDKDLDVSFCGLGSIAPARPLGSVLNRADLPIIDARWRGWHYQNLQETIYSTHPVAWYSPEMIAQDFEGYGKPADIYSLGMTLAEMFTGIAPYVGTITPSLIFLKKLTLKEPLLLPCPPGRTASGDMLAIFESCTHLDPNRRPTAEDLLRTPWVQCGLATPLRESLLAPFRQQ
ncbi:hypothetical protein TcWFU_001678 [Taenia crassiceps]|uniref:Protein kinase domain-containing protein n=1 Tax=Taenia crassiceps TaxID=6207 RepID=A0ABR4QA96_9CEST